MGFTAHLFSAFQTFHVWLKKIMKWDVHTIETSVHFWGISTILHYSGSTIIYPHYQQEIFSYFDGLPANSQHGVTNNREELHMVSFKKVMPATLPVALCAGLLVGCGSEKNAKMALSIAHRAYVIETGSIVLSGEAKDLMNSKSVHRNTRYECGRCL